jgi:hypothetical protein
MGQNLFGQYVKDGSIPFEALELDVQNTLNRVSNEASSGTSGYMSGEIYDQLQTVVTDLEDLSDQVDTNTSNISTNSSNISTLTTNVTNNANAITAEASTRGQVDTYLQSQITVLQSASSGTSGVSTFNTRSGAVTLTSSDVTTALGFTPATSSGTSGSATIASAFNKFQGFLNPKKKFAYAYTTGTSVTSVGFNQTLTGTVGTPDSAYDGEAWAYGKFIKISQTALTANANAGWIGGTSTTGHFVYPQGNFSIISKFVIGGTAGFANNSRFFVGLTTASLSTTLTSDTPSCSQVGFQYYTSRGDTQWKVISRYNNSTATITNLNNVSGGSPFTFSYGYYTSIISYNYLTGVYSFRLEKLDNGTLTVAEATVTDAGTTGYLWPFIGFQMVDAQAAARAFLFGQMYLETE